MIMLKFGSLEIQTLAALSLEQTYAPIGGESILRNVIGGGIKQSSWKKTRITTSGSGWLPAGLDALDTSTAITLACVVPRTVAAVFATRQATLPTTRRSDAGHTPWGVAIMGDGSAIKTTATLVGNVATLGAVAGAVAYQAMYLPQYSVLAMRPTDSGERSDASYRWEIVCEEV